MVVPDSHGCFIDWRAARAMLDDLESIQPSEIVLLGDHVDVSGIFSQHQNHYLGDLAYSYEEDCDAANKFLDELVSRAPNAAMHYLEGNHEQHVERWVSRTVRSERDAQAHAEVLSPAKKLQLKVRGIRYYSMADFHGGLTVRGTIRLGKCFFTHGFSAAKHATATHVASYGACVVHGHTHRAQEHRTSTVASGAIGAWCPGTLAERQPLYKHTAPSEWAHGYGLQCVAGNGTFLHINVPIVNGVSMLGAMMQQGLIRG